MYSNNTDLNDSIYRLIHRHYEIETTILNNCELIPTKSIVFNDLCSDQICPECGCDHSFRPNFDGVKTSIDVIPELLKRPNNNKVKIKEADRCLRRRNRRYIFSKSSK
jgi:hypothetical protein